MPKRPPTEHDDMRERLRAALRAAEVPDCGCRREYEPCGCRGYCTPGEREHGPLARCDCPIGFARPCPHVLATTHTIPFDRWADLMTAANPVEYLEPPAPYVPALEVGREAHAEIKRRRLESGHGLWHERDRTADEWDRLGFRVGLTGNNRPLQEELLTLGDGDGTSDESERPGWDREMIRTLELHQQRAKKARRSQRRKRAR